VSGVGGVKVNKKQKIEFLEIKVKELEEMNDALIKVVDKFVGKFGYSLKVWYPLRKIDLEEFGNFFRVKIENRLEKRPVKMKHLKTLEKYLGIKLIKEKKETKFYYKKKGKKDE